MINGFFTLSEITRLFGNNSKTHNAFHQSEILSSVRDEFHHQGRGLAPLDGKLNATVAYMTKKLKIRGDLALAMKLGSLLH